MHRNTKAEQVVRFVAHCWSDGVSMITTEMVERAIPNIDVSIALDRLARGGFFMKAEKDDFHLPERYECRKGGEGEFAYAERCYDAGRALESKPSYEDAMTAFEVLAGYFGLVYRARTTN